MRAYLQLLRPANIITAWADILLGLAAAGVLVIDSATDLTSLSWPAIGWLLLATTGLYGGGVVLNDVFDLEIDRVERPERPLPGGRASVRGATLLGTGLLVSGVAAAAQVSARSAALAGAVALLAVVYDAYGKHHSVFGPLNMGACRGGNLLLGMSALSLPGWSWALALIPVAYIAAITLISRGEVGGSGRRPLWLGLIAYAVVLGAILVLSLLSPRPWPATLPFLLLFAALILPPLVRAIREPSGRRIGGAVRAGVLALIAMDAALAAALAGWPAGLLILALLPLSRVVARFFAVT